MTWPLKWRKKSKQSRAKRLETYESIIIKLSIWFCFETYLKRKKILALLSLPWSRAHGSGFECSLRRSAMEVFLVFIHVLQIDRFNRRSGCNSTTRFHRNMRCDGRNVSVSVHLVHLLKLYLHPVPVCVCVCSVHTVNLARVSSRECLHLWCLVGWCWVRDAAPPRLMCLHSFGFLWFSLFVHKIYIYFGLFRRSPFSELVSLFCCFRFIAS